MSGNKMNAAVAAAAAEIKPREVHIEMDFPVPINGTPVSRITMRRMTVGDRLAVARENPAMSSEEREAVMFAGLCSLAVKELEELDDRDYGKLQEKFVEITQRKARPGHDDKPNSEPEVTLKFRYPVMIGGAVHETVTMRRPKVKDRLLIARQYPNVTTFSVLMLLLHFYFPKNLNTET